jgi:hypothetical protein
MVCAETHIKFLILHIIFQQTARLRQAGTGLPARSRKMAWDIRRKPLEQSPQRHPRPHAGGLVVGMNGHVNRKRRHPLGAELGLKAVSVLLIGVISCGLSDSERLPRSSPPSKGSKSPASSPLRVRPLAGSHDHGVCKAPLHLVSAFATTALNSADAHRRAQGEQPSPDRKAG